MIRSSQYISALVHDDGPNVPKMSTESIHMLVRCFKNCNNIYIYFFSSVYAAYYQLKLLKANFFCSNHPL